MSRLQSVDLFTGIGGITLGFEWAGIDPLVMCEWDGDCRRVLDQHWPEVRKEKDVRDFDAREYRGRADIVTGGFPCQDISIAASAIRKGLSGERSGLFFELVRIVDEVRPKYVVWENVPGLLSSWSGSPEEIGEDGEWEEESDLLTVMETLRDIGYTGGYRVVDSRYFGVPQRRRRVVGVFSRGLSGWRRAGSILLDPDGGGWTPPKGNEEIDSNLHGAALCLKASGGYKGCVTHETYVAVGIPPTPHGVPCGVHANQRGELRTSALAGSLTASRSGKQFEGVAVVCPPPDAEGEGEAAGVPGWVDVGPKELDSRREKQLGNAVTTMMAYYFGSRIVQLEEFLEQHPELDPED